MILYFPVPTFSVTQSITDLEEKKRELYNLRHKNFTASTIFLSLDHQSLVRLGAAVLRLQNQYLSDIYVKQCIFIKGKMRSYCRPCSLYNFWTTSVCLQKYPHLTCIENSYRTVTIAPEPKEHIAKFLGNI